jgi:hypothetical protein
VVRDHAADDPTKFTCDRCNRSFVSKKEMQVHSKLPPEKMCQSREVDPEDGPDSETCRRILDKAHRPPTDTIESEYAQLWELLFSGDEPPVQNGRIDCGKCPTRSNLVKLMGCSRVLILRARVPARRRALRAGRALQGRVHIPAGVSCASSLLQTHSGAARQAT